MAALSLTERLEYLRHRSPKWLAVYNALVDRLRALQVGANAPSVGQRFPDMALPDHLGHYRTLASLLQHGPLVLTFSRGGWCDYCVSELESWHDALPGLEAAGGMLAVVTGEIHGRSRALADIASAGSVALCDVDFGVALELGLAFYLGGAVLAEYVTEVPDMAELYGGTAGILPVPATFVIRPDGIIAYAFTDVDFRSRAEPADVIAAVAAIAR